MTHPWKEDSRPLARYQPEPEFKAAGWLEYQMRWFHLYEQDGGEAQSYSTDLEDIPVPSHRLFSCDPESGEEHLVNIGQRISCSYQENIEPDYVKLRQDLADELLSEQEKKWQAEQAKLNRAVESRLYEEEEKRRKRTSRPLAPDRQKKREERIQKEVAKTLTKRRQKTESKKSRKDRERLGGKWDRFLTQTIGMPYGTFTVTKMVRFSEVYEYCLFELQCVCGRTTCEYPRDFKSDMTCGKCRLDPNIYPSLDKTGVRGRGELVPPRRLHPNTRLQLSRMFEQDWSDESLARLFNMEPGEIAWFRERHGNVS